MCESIHSVGNHFHKSFWSPWIDSYLWWIDLLS